MKDPTTCRHWNVEDCTNCSRCKWSYAKCDNCEHWERSEQKPTSGICDRTHHVCGFLYCCDDWLEKQREQRPTRQCATRRCGNCGLWNVLSCKTIDDRAVCQHLGIKTDRGFGCVCWEREEKEPDQSFRIGLFEISLVGDAVYVRSTAGGESLSLTAPGMHDYPCKLFHWLNLRLP